MYIKFFSPFLKCQHVLCRFGFFTLLVSAPGSRAALPPIVTQRSGRWAPWAARVGSEVPAPVRFPGLPWTIVPGFDSSYFAEFTYFKSYNKNNVTFISFLARC